MINMADGTSKPVAKRGFTTKKVALAAMREAQSASDKGSFIDPSRLPTGAYLDEWLDGLRLGASTVASYRKNVRLHVKPYIGTVPLASLTTARIDAMYRELETTGRKDHREGDGLGPRTTRYVHTILSSALAAAVESSRLARNPAAKAHPPTAKQAKSPEMRPWTADQLATFLDWSREHSPYHFAWHMLAMTGMRRGEALELRWRDFNPETASIMVRRSAGVIRNKGEGAAVMVGPTKGGAARMVNLDPVTVAMGKTQRRERGLVSLQLAAADALILGDAEGRHLHPEHFSRTFRETLARCRKDLPDLSVIRLHDLRHTHATVLLSKGVPVKTVSARLGHASAVVTMTVYAHCLPGDQASAAAIFASVVKGAR